MHIKLVAVLGFVAAASAADLTVGGDCGRIIYEQNVTASPAIWRQVHNLTVTANSTKEKISRIVVIDNRPEKDGEAKVVDGGEGHENVTIELKSPAVFRGYDFSVQVFTAPGAVYNSQSPKKPISSGLDTQKAQVSSKDFDLNQGQKINKDKDIILQGSKPTASSTTEATKVNKNSDKQQKANPALVGQEQTRLYRDTKAQMTNGQVPLPVDIPSYNVAPTKDIKTEANDKTQVKHDFDSIEDFGKTISSTFSDNSTQKTENSVNIKVEPMQHQINKGKVQGDLAHSDDQQRTDLGAEKISAVPALNKEQKDHHHQPTSTPKNNFSSTTPKNTEGQETLVPKVTPVSIGDFSSTHAPELTTKVTKAAENTTPSTSSIHLKGASNVEHQHAVPLPNNGQVPLPVDITSHSVAPTKDTKTEANHKTQIKHDFDSIEDFEETISSTFSDNSTQKTENSVNMKVKPMQPQINKGKVQGDLAHSDDQKRTDLGAEKMSAVPALNKEQKDHHHQPASTPKNHLSSTTPKNTEGQETLVPKVIPVSKGDFSSTHAPELTTKVTKAAENTTPSTSSIHLKGHHVEHQHAVPLPYKQ